MKRLFFILVLIGIGFAIGVSYREIRAEIRAKRQLQRKQTAYATEPVIHNKSFVVITYAQDMEDFVPQSLLSTLNQNYSDFRIIYIDDGLNMDLSFVEKYDQEEKVTYVRNVNPIGSIEGLYRAIHSCKSDEIVVLLRNEEMFAHSDVLSDLNRYFADSSMWMASGEEMRCNSFEKVDAGESYQVFYAGLFKHINLQDFLTDGTFKTGAYEKEIAAPLLELSGEHAYLIPKPLLLSQIDKSEVSSARTKNYARVKENPWHDHIMDEERVDVVVFSYNRPLQLYAFLESSDKHLENLHRQFVIYRAGNDHYERGYQKVKEAFPQVMYIRQSVENPSEDFAPVVQKTVFDRNVSTAHYVAFALDDNVIRESIDLKKATQSLKETGAYGFYFRLGRNLDSHLEEKRIPIAEGVNAWQFSEMDGEWAVPNSVNMALFKKKDIYPYFLCMKFHSPNLLQALWNEHADLSQVGLYYDQSKVVNLPLNIVMENEMVDGQNAKISTKELLTFFDQGLKMDIVPLEQIENKSVEIEFMPEFTRR